MGRGEVSGFTVPAINIRALTYDTAQAVFRAALAAGVGAVIFEIARSEIDYTRQRPEEYTCAVTAAALKTGYRGPLFLQGDHFQVGAKKYAAGSGGRGQGRQGPDLGGDRRRILQHRHRHLDARRSEGADGVGAAEAQLQPCRRAHDDDPGSGTGGNHDLRRRGDRRGRRQEQHGGGAAGLHGRLPGSISRKAGRP